MNFKTPLQSISKSYFRSPVLRPEIDRFSYFLKIPSPPPPPPPPPPPLLTKVDITLENLVQEAIRQTNSRLNTEEIESQIDLVIYKLYDLDYEEVFIIDPNFEMAESEYNAFQV
ncbi:MAG: hypothetical protein IPL23_02920 [Saprospiraceae bacterium]|nr:hypothetical protein [Saprospiraceae bacterium]